MQHTYSFFAFAVLLAVGCATQKPMATTPSKYTQDLSVWRPAIEVPRDTSAEQTSANSESRQTIMVEPKHTINEPLNAVLDSIDKINLMRRLIDGFTIQVFSGDKEGALQAKKQLALAVPDIESEVKFITPTYRVKAGRYFSRLEAQKDFMTVKKYFPGAIVIPDKIAIN